MIVYSDADRSAAVADALKGYLNYMLTEGQTLAPTVGYAALPDELQAKAIAQLSSIAG